MRRKATAKTAIVDDEIVKVGDVVSFKCDVEQYGRITAIKNDPYRGIYLVLEPLDHCFSGYIAGATEHEEDPDRCWL